MSATVTWLTPVTMIITGSIIFDYCLWAAIFPIGKDQWSSTTQGLIIAELNQVSEPTKPVARDDEKSLTEDIISLASEYGRYGYRRITALLRRKGWQVNHKKVERLWRREGLKVPQNQPK